MNIYAVVTAGPYAVGVEGNNAKEAALLWRKLEVARGVKEIPAIKAMYVMAENRGFWPVGEVEECGVLCQR